MSISIAPSASIAAHLETKEGVCALSYEPLNAEKIIKSVGDESAGAIVSFIGTTRNSFKGKVVTRLEYQAYTKLAMKTMADILRNAWESISRSAHHPTNQQVPSLIRCALWHRLGTVPVGEASIVIAVSSPHRKEAFVACEQILEDVKRRAQIWKREYYEGESEEDAQWKENN